MADSVTLTIQAASEQLARNLSWTENEVDLGGFTDRARVDAQIEALEDLIRDRRAILAAYDGFAPPPRAALERHAWLAIREAQLNVRDAPDSWEVGRVQEIEAAAERGAEWLRAAGLPSPERYD